MLYLMVPHRAITCMLQELLITLHNIGEGVWTIAPSVLIPVSDTKDAHNCAVGNEKLEM